MKEKNRKHKIRQGVEWALLGRSRFSEKKKPSRKSNKQFRQDSKLKLKKGEWD